MVRQHHGLIGHEFEQTPGDSEGQESLAWGSPWGCKELDMIQRLNSNNMENSIEGPEKIEIELPYDQQFHL